MKRVKKSFILNNFINSHNYNLEFSEMLSGFHEKFKR